MQSFTDTANRRWDLTLSIATVKRVRNLTGVDILAMLDRPQLLSDLAADPVAFVDVLYVIVKPQADTAGVTDESFGESLDGTSIESATDAFLEALVDFFPGARRATLRRVLAKTMEHKARAEATLKTALDDGTIDRAIDESLTAGETSTSSPAASASTPPA